MKNNYQKDKNREIIIGFSGIFLTFFIIGTNTYYYIYITYFLIIVIFMNLNNIREKIFLFFSLNISAIILTMIVQNWIYWKSNLKGMLLDKIILLNTDKDLIKHYTGVIFSDTERFLYVDKLLYVIYFVCSVFLIIYSCLNKNINDKEYDFGLLKKQNMIMAVIMFVACNVPIVAALIYN